MKTKKEHISVQKKLGEVEVKLEMGKLAPQADSAVVASMGQTTVLATVVSKPATESLDFFPLTVNYEERFYAGGIIGGSRFMRREGRPTDDAIVSGRLIDHSIRPLFPKDFMDETQLVISILSIDSKYDPAMLGFLAASAALSTAGIPFKGPLAPLRVQRIKGEFVASMLTEQEDADLDIVVSYLDEGKKVHALEAHAHIVSEEDVAKAIEYGAEQSKVIFELLEDFAKEADVDGSQYTSAWLNKNAIKEIEVKAFPAIEKLHKEGVSYKDPKWNEKLAEFVDSIAEEHEDKYTKKQLSILASEVQKNWVRDMVVNQKKRIDGREFDEVRPLKAEVGILPRVHGTGLFERGITQVLNVATLASPGNSLLIQHMADEESRTYLHHYNFPPFSVGEVGRMFGPSRRSIGHGMLAMKSILPVLPSEDEFPYVIRTVSEVFSSNGSTSMAATCGSSLSLMDAGVPIKAHVAGIGVGLFVDASKDNPTADEHILLTDIVGLEDFAGYMDFKMTGTREGVTVIQMELKVKGIPIELIKPILQTSHDARMKVLDVMDAAISKPREELSEFAPKIEFVKIEKDQIGQVIGSGGSVIKGIMEEMSVEIDIEEKDNFALVVISAISAEDIARAKKYVEDLLRVPEVGEVYEGKVVRVEDYGAFVELWPEQQALLHISEFSYQYVGNIADVAKLGDTVQVKVIGIENGKTSVSKKALDKPPEGYQERPAGGGRRDNRGKRY